MRRRPPDRTLAWAAHAIAPGARVVRVRRLRNAWASAVHAVDVADGDRVARLVLRRWARTDLAPDPFVVENETAVLTLLAAHDLPVPRLVATDAAGAETDAPAVLMTRLPGKDDIDPSNVDRWIEGLASTLRAIHAVDAPAGTPIAFSHYRRDPDQGPPAWSTRPDLWQRAIDAFHAGPPGPPPPALCHRDFWPGNVLWSRGRVSGVVDWTDSCRGPAALDVAHCRLNLANLAGQDAADEFARRYGAIADLAWYDIADAVGMNYGPPEAWRYHDAGRTDITPEGMVERMETFIDRALIQLGA